MNRQEFQALSKAIVEPQFVKRMQEIYGGLGAVPPVVDEDFLNAATTSLNHKRPFFYLIDGATNEEITNEQLQPYVTALLNIPIFDPGCKDQLPEIDRTWLAMQNFIIVDPHGGFRESDELFGSTSSWVVRDQNGHLVSGLYSWR
jgi:hypothetical protein